MPDAPPLEEGSRYQASGKPASKTARAASQKQGPPSVPKGTAFRPATEQNQVPVPISVAASRSAFPVWNEMTLQRAAAHLCAVDPCKSFDNHRSHDLPYMVFFWENLALP